MNNTLHSILKQYWKFETFRPLQEEIIRSVLSGRDTLALLPTSGGKSLCYHLPSMAMEGMCLVVSPLIALMKDQVEDLSKKSITAFAVYSGMKRHEIINTLKTATNSNCKFLYVSPERLETALFQEYLPALHINMIAVDEAHCISQWGYDFRPSYLRIATLKATLPGVPVLALSASATPEVQKDICEQLLMNQPSVFRSSFARPLLSHSVFSTQIKMDKLTDILQTVPGSSIVYCKSRRQTEEVSRQLTARNFPADFYHAGLGREQRANVQENWKKNKIRIIVCTNAFGMGIDKPDVRSVIHMNLPDAVENYYQEAGRAGRDGKKAYAVVLYQDRDLDDLKKQVALRFPEIAIIRTIYQAIANYLQLPVGNGEGMYFDFDLEDFLQKFNLPSREVIATLQVLEQESYLSFNEQVLVPSGVQFVCTKERLYQFEKEIPALEPLINLLLRSYEGIFDRTSSIFEKQLAGQLKKDTQEIKQGLIELQRFHIIDYESQKDSPQLYFLQARRKAEDLSFNFEAYSKRKKLAERRSLDFIGYLLNSKDCRSQYLGAYFGDSLLGPCGICDNCLSTKKSMLGTASNSGTG